MKTYTIILLFIMLVFAINCNSSVKNIKLSDIFQNQLTLEDLDNNSKMIALGTIGRDAFGYHLKLQRNIRFPTGTTYLSLEGLDKNLLKDITNKQVVVFYSIPLCKIIACIRYEGQNKKLIDSFYKIETQKVVNETAIVFPDFPSIDQEVYENIKVTCYTRWNIKKMNIDTLRVVADKDEYAVHCDGSVDGELYHFVIRVDAKGQWINDGRTKKNP